MRYFLGFLVSVGLIVLVFILILHDFSSPKPAGPPLVDQASTNSVVQMTEQGPLVADQKFQGYRITVGQNETEITTLQGYDEAVVGTKIYNNTELGYAQFLRALDFAGFQKGSKDQSKSDARGYCPNGDRYTFEIIENGQDTEKFWKTSCGQGNFGGSLSQAKALFAAQVPDFDDITGSLNL